MWEIIEDMAMIYSVSFLEEKERNAIWLARELEPPWRYGAVPPVGSRGKAPDQRFRGRALLKLKVFLHIRQIWHFLRAFRCFCCAILCKRGLSRHAVSVRPVCSLCVYVTFVDSVKTNKHIFINCSPLGSDTILVFPYQTLWQYSDGNPPNGGVECRWGTQKSRFRLHRVL